MTDIYCDAKCEFQKENKCTRLIVTISQIESDEFPICETIKKIKKM